MARLYKCSLSGLGTFYVIADDETAARRAVEQRWADWGYNVREGRVIKIETLAEDGQYPDVPDAGAVGAKTWLIFPEAPF